MKKRAITMIISHVVPREAAGLRTPAASHRPLPTLGYFRWVTFKLFVQYWFIIRALFALIRALSKILAQIRKFCRLLFQFSSENLHSGLRQEGPALHQLYFFQCSSKSDHRKPPKLISSIYFRKVSLIFSEVP